MSKPLRFTRILIVMSKSFLHGILLTCLFTSILLANDGNAQHKNMKEVMVSIDLEDATLRQMINTLEAQTEFKFIYSGDFLTKTDDYRITLTADNKSVAHVLQQVASTTGLLFQQNDGAIAIGTDDLKEEEPPVTLTKPVLEQDISGKVTDEDGAPLPGASVLVKGTSIGVITDADGNYRISAPDEATTLVFSFVGYERQEIEIGGRSIIDISLTLDVTTLGEVTINAGYYTVKERESTGNIRKLSAEEIDKQPIANPLQALQGRIAGVHIEQATGVPGGGFSVKIRGTNSISGGNDPLYLVDGVPFTSTSLSSSFVGSAIVSNANPLNSINPADIESIEVLKDADATAIYGSRGANGVVVITTKRGSSEKTKVDLNIYTGIGKVAGEMDVLNTEQYLEMRREAFVNDGRTPNTGNAFDLLEWDSTRNTDWQKELIGGTANITNAQTSISGGNAQTQFSIGGGYYNETTVFPGDFYDRRISARFSINHTSEDKKFNFAFNGNYVANTSKLYSSDITGTALILPPHTPDLFDENDDLLFPLRSSTNPYSALRRDYEATTDNFVGNTIISYEVLPGLQFKTTLGYTNIRRDEFQTTPQSTIRPASGEQASARFANNSIKTWITEPQINWQKEIGDGWLNILVGATFQENIGEGQTQEGIGFSTDALLQNITAADDIRIVNDNYTQYRYQAIFGRINYNWKGKYIVNLTARRDGSSRFGPGNQFASFGAIGGAWIFSEESFIQNNVPFLSFGKLRASYGTTGNDQIGEYEFLELWRPTDFTYNGNSGLRPLRLANPEYRWEVNRKMEAAIDLGFFEDRIFLSASYYHNRSSSQLVGFSLPLSSGFTTVRDNFDAIVENTGWEFELSTTNVKTANFSWDIAFNITIPNNELVSYPDIENSPFASLLEVGKPLTIVSAFHFTGVDPETGVYTFEDVDGNGNDRDNPADLQRLERIDQKFFGGFQNSLTYKGLQLDFLFQFVKQTGRNYLGQLLPPGWIGVNQPTAVLDRWQNPGDVTEVQKFTQRPTPVFRYHRANSDVRISDASFIRLKNVSLSYQLPIIRSNKVNLENSRLYIQGQNLLTITDFIGMDPENQNVRFLPPLRVITAGVQITF